MEIDTKGSIKMENSMERVNMFGQMDHAIKASS
jgi:hypothetical protein